MLNLPETNNRTILKVSELNEEVSLLLGRGFPVLWVEGEISNFSCPASGHFYFSLKDEKAQIRCAMFRNRNRHLSIRPENGMKVLIRGRVGLYEPRGEFQLIAEHMEEAGSGLLQLQFEQLMAKLAAKGWFDDSIKKPLPDFPKKIGIITSPTGAAIRDILNVLKRRCPQIPVLIYPAAVQGERSALELETALKKAIKDKDCDVLVLARGGGSIEDLAAFNDESLAKTIHASDIPIVSGVGHEIDFTIADFVADKRAPTPSAAAELISPDTRQLKIDIKNYQQKLLQLMQIRLRNKTQNLEWLSKRLDQQKPSYRLHQQAQRVDELEARLTKTIWNIIERKQQKLATVNQRLTSNSPQKLLSLKRQNIQQKIVLLQHAMEKQLTNKKAAISLQSSKLDALSPLKTLDRGYAIVRDEKQSGVISSVEQLNVNEITRTKLKDGEVISKVLSIQKS